MITLAVTNQKGGVGKTTTTVALGAIMAEKGLRVLLVDLDPQGSLTQFFGRDPNGKSLADVFGGALEGTLKISKTIQPIQSNFDLVPSTLRLSASELGIVSRWERESILKNALEEIEDYDVSLIDCPPSMGLLTANGIVAAQGVIIPSLPAVSDLRGVRLLFRTLERVKDGGLNEGIQVLGLILVQFDARTREHPRVLEMIKSAGYPILGLIPRSVRIQEAIGAKKSITEYDPSGKPALAYQKVAKGVIDWVKKNRPPDELKFMKALE